MADWQKGDLALCVDDRANPVFGQAIVRKGRVYTVESVGPVRGNPVFGPCVALFLTGVACTSKNGFGAARFRKVTPPADMTLDEEELSPPTPVEA